MVQSNVVEGVGQFESTSLTREMSRYVRDRIQVLWLNQHAPDVRFSTSEVGRCVLTLESSQKSFTGLTASDCIESAIDQLDSSVLVS